MSIIISKQGEATQKLDRAEFEKEDYLQNYIHENPESIPVYEIQENKKLLVVAREFPTESGPIDALAIDRDGDLYIVETKLYKNPDKRTVVAQALDYGASLWKHLNDFSEFIRIIDAEIQAKFHLTLEEKAKNFFGIEQAEIQIMLDRMMINLKEGNIKFVILMDSMDERLKDLIIYVNQNSQFDIYAVQLEYYKFQEYEIMIPKIFGVEVKKNIKGVYGGTRRKWTKEEFILDSQQKTDSKTLKTITDLLDFSYTHADKVTYGTGNDGVFRYVLTTPKGEITPFFVKSDGKIVFNLDWVLEQKKLPEDLIENFVQELESIEKTNNENGKILLDLTSLTENYKELDKLKEAIIKFTKEVNSNN